MGDFFFAPYFQKGVLFPSAEFSLEIIGEFNEPIGMYRTRNNMLKIDKE